LSGEEVGVAKAMVLAVHGFDLVVGSFERAGGDRAIVPSQNALRMVALRWPMMLVTQIAPGMSLC
jgi:hypothetical protein